MNFSFNYIVERTASLLAAIILLQTLFFKFSGAEESTFIFSSLGIEPWGRIGTVILELAAGLMLLSRAFSAVGALLGAGLMAGAIMSHLLILGIEVQGDGGWLFALAVAVFVSNIITLIMMRAQFRPQLRRFLPFLR